MKHLNEENVDPQEVERKITLSRRSFMLSTIGAGLAAATVGIASGKADKQLEDTDAVVDRTIERAMTSHRNILITIIETMAFERGQEYLSKFIDKLGINSGNRVEESDVHYVLEENHPALMRIKDLLAMPIAEEAMFRCMASGVFVEKGFGLKTGIASSLVFAAAHNLSKNEDNSINIHLDSAPLTHITLGMYLWYLMQQEGYINAVVGHITHNSMIEIYDLLGSLKRDK
ncbi:CPBP family intramembrane metalloprotease [Candidatus Peregrinibacteria bacterium]|nr:CPBP family intramembrane metalloprotease [Candidatus Peregrinibacteria bacterium]MBT4367160.1 CPBP family intramembrane metalloprotease [Candidatus Peregrinibacteria bacterium]MBT4585317.1 CPBP family intramembrane metalloprotease [Candidatus Peregrinibacteria bacterium]MBT6731056.1 CPBP family intramembrane metalloprotease [Candidatus Peregrinibacteria bacterium]MBT7009092.1 CPBP family intramembrane metalloprotease [Candidatus Peregrinibacteria bacterium]